MHSLILSTFEYLQVISSKRSCVHFSNKSVTLISSLSELVDIVDTYSRHLKKAVLAAARLRNLCIEKEKKVQVKFSVELSTPPTHQQQHTHSFHIHNNLLFSALPR